ncbi:glycoside hydrolase family 16 protein [Gymnopilus junonius]|uniref:Glycoside hydrolase family 16 protein n=1 Tax=Gymnopilus junonius TaxID=109634 RepID=A0A9P5NRN9_GYMJU|nr:glycoside hydrolase family 16 protein [Gymnopilus junonius]
MRSVLAFIFSFVPLFALAGKFHESPLRPRHGGRSRSLAPRNTTSSRTFVLKDYYQGQSFLNDWDFFTGDDPTHGSVNFQSREDAIKKGLAFVQADGTTVLAVDDFTTLPVGSKRDTVRISSKKSYNSGLFIADFFSMPHGCSVWPAYWSVGPQWPAGGEIDVIEGVNTQTTNQYTLHTSEGCDIGAATQGKTLVANLATSNILNTQCASSDQDNRGCAFLDSDASTYGHGFNILSGGVYAHLWESTGIKVWRFSRDSIPADVTAKNPNPSSWGTPAANWPSTSCDIASHFFDHNLVIDTTLCGDFADSNYAQSGCPGTCAQAVANATNFKFAKWNINYVAVYE